MAVTEPSVLEDVLQRLEALLRRAQSIKSANLTNTFLPVSEFSGDNGLPPQDVGSKVHAAAVEVAARRIFQMLVGQETIESKGFGQIWNLLDLLQILGDQEQCEPILVWYLIEELLESQSIEGCRVVFDYLESRLERLAKHFEKVNLVILRSCNDLLRRLSRADDAVFCGRVFIFVFKSFPLGDKSSVNRHGDFNTDNVTTFDELPVPNIADASNTDQDAMDTSAETGQESGGSEAKENERKEPIDTNVLYPIFWGMQKSFAYPPQVLQPETFAHFKRSFEDTLTKFKNMPKLLSSNASERDRGTKRDIEGLEIDDFRVSLNPKYLTSRELFGLELNDLVFQRHVLVQALILVEFLLSSYERSKKPPLEGSALKIYPFNLPEQDVEWAIQIKKSIVLALRDAADGPAFARVVETVISRDKNWVRWKETNCHPISLRPIDAGVFAEATDTIKSECTWKRFRAGALGSLDLGFLSDTGSLNGIEQLSASSRFSLPDVQSLVQDVTTVDLDLEMAMTDEETSMLQESKTSKTWRALRVASHTKLNMFDNLADGKNLDCLIDKGVVQITEADDTQDVEGVDEEGSRPVQNDDPRDTSERPENAPTQEANPE